jgi:hypothetical protein
MVRVVALFVAVMFLLASPAFAQSFKSTSTQTQPPAVKLNLSAKAAGIDAIAAAAVRDAGKLAPRPASSMPSAAKRSFWKGPWPYVMIGAAVAIGLAIAYSGDGSGSGY